MTPVSVILLAEVMHSLHWTQFQLVHLQFLYKRNETTSLRWRAHAAKAAVSYHTLDDISEKDEKNEKKEKQARGRLCCGTRAMDGVAAAAGMKWTRELVWYRSKGIAKMSSLFVLPTVL